MSANSTANGTAVATRSRFDSNDLRSIGSFADLGNLVKDRGIAVVDSRDVLGDGFELVPTPEKTRLVGVPFVIVDYSFAQGDNGEFATMRIVTKRDEKLIVNDGSTGIRDQLHQLDAAGIDGVILVERGLRVSEYTVELPNPKTGELEPSKAKTFYLAV